MAWRQGLAKAVTSAPGTQVFLQRTLVIHPNAAVCSVCDTVEISCVSFVPRRMIGFLVTLSYCVMAFFLLCTILPSLQTVYKMLYFLINLFSIRHTLCKSSLS